MWLVLLVSCVTRPPSTEVVVLDAPSPEVSDEVATHARRTLDDLRDVLGPERMPEQVTVRLRGAADPGELPTVDPQTGEVWLYTFPGPTGGYTASASHELVHAVRHSLWMDASRQTSPFLFLEEGLAEVLATEIGSPSAGFPLYGTPLSVAAGQWLVRGEDLPIEAMVAHHSALNFRCMAQVYVLRLSFVSWLRQTRGLEPLLELAYASDPVSVADLEEAMGAPLDTLEAEWRVWALDRYQAVEGADALADRFRTQSPIQYFPVCGPEVLATPPSRQGGLLGRGQQVPQPHW